MSQHGRALTSLSFPSSQFGEGASIDRRRWLQMAAAGGIGCSLSALAGPARAVAQEAGELDRDSAEEGSAEEGGESLLRYEDPKVQRYRCGLILDTRKAACRGIVATFPIPRPWPEQQVQLVDQTVDAPFAQSWQVRELDDLVSQVVMHAAALPPATTVEATFTFELTRSRVVGPESTDQLSIPARAGRPLRQYLISSPYIDPGSARIRAAVREIEALPAESDWKRVETIYDWVRDKVEYVEGEIKTADQALKDGNGDCEELTSVFVAICRAMRIPARMVHVLQHCYPEFYLEDAEGSGHWFPCQAAGTRQFGSMEEYRPILQKGDRFKTPEQSLQRYVAEFFKAAAVKGGKPKPRFIQELLD